MPLGVALASALDVFQLNWEFVLPMAPVGMTVYYLAWKHSGGISQSGGRHRLRFQSLLRTSPMT